MATLTERQRGELIRRYPFRVADEVMRGQRPVPQDIAEIEPTIEQPRRSAAAAARAFTDPGSSIDPRLTDWAAGRVQDGTGPSTVSTTPPPSGRRGTGVPEPTTMRDRIMRGTASMGHIPTPTPQQRGAFPELMERPLVEPEPGPTRREKFSAVLSGTEPSRVVVGGASDLIRSALGILPYMPPFANSPLAEYQIRRLQEAIPQVAEPETPTGRLVREAIPPVVSGVAGAGVGGLAGAGGGLARGLTGFATSVGLPAVFDAALIPPEDPNVSAVLRSEFGLTDPITGALATNPQDPEIINRLRNAAEAGIVGGAVDLGVRGARFLSPRMRRLATEGVPEPRPTVEQPRPTVEQPVVEQPRPVVEQPAFEAARPAIGPEQFGPRVEPPDYADNPYIPGLEPPPPRGLELVTPETLTGARQLEVPEPAMPSNVNIRNIRSVEDVETAIRQISDASGGFDAARRGVVHDDALDGMARALGYTAEKVSRMLPLELMSPERMLAARRVMVGSAERLQGLARQYMDEITRLGGDASKVPARLTTDFREALVQHAGIQEAVQGATAEAGRLLRQFGLMAEGDLTANIGAAFPAIRGMNPTNIDNALKAVADRLTNMDDAGQAANFLGSVRRISKSEWFFDSVYWYWINSILSGPQTHMVNVMSNALTQGMDMVEHGIASGIGAIRGGADRITAGELLARLHGAWSGMNRGLRSAGRVVLGLDEGFSIADESKHAMSREPIRLPNGRYIPLTPTRFLSAEDVFFRSTAEGMEAYGLAFRRGLEQNLAGADLTRFVDDFLKNPPEDAAAIIARRGRELTYTLPFESRGGRTLISFFRDFNVGGFKPMRYIVPFITTPSNLIKYAARRSPLGVFSRGFREAMRQGGAARDLAIARITVGTSIMGAAAYEWGRGNITGAGPTDYRERARLYRQGWQPYSIRIPGIGWVSYRRLDPWAILMGTTVDLLDTMGEVDLDESILDQAGEIGASLIAAASQSILDKVFFTGLAQFFEVINDPQRYGERWTERFITSWLPNLSAQTARMMDPWMRETDGLLQAFMERIPGLRERLALRQDLWGRDIPWRYLGRFLPFSVSEETPNPVDQELERLDIAPGMPREVVDGVSLTPEQYQAFMKHYGPRAFNAIRDMIQDPAYDELSDEERRRAVYGILRDARQYANDQMRETDPEIEQAIRETAITRRMELGASRELGEELHRHNYDARTGSMPNDITLTPYRRIIHDRLFNMALSMLLEQNRELYNQQTPEAQRRMLIRLARQAREVADAEMMDRIMRPTEDRRGAQAATPSGGGIVRASLTDPVRRTPGRDMAGPHDTMTRTIEEELPQSVEEPEEPEDGPTPRSRRRRAPRATPAASRGIPRVGATSIDHALDRMGQTIGGMDIAQLQSGLPTTREFGDVVSLGGFGGSSQPSAPAIQRVSSRPINVAQAGQMPNTLTPRGGAPSGGGGFMNWLASDQGRGVSRMLMDFGTTLMQNAGPSTTPVNPWGNALAALSESMGRVADERRDRQERTQEAQRLTEYYASLGEQAAQLPLDPQIMGVARTMLSNPETSDRGLSILTDQIRQLGTARARGYEPYNRGAPQYRNREGQDVSSIVAQARELVRRDPDMLQDMRYRLWSEYGIDPDLLSE